MSVKRTIATLALTTAIYTTYHFSDHLPKLGTASATTEVETVNAPPPSVTISLAIQKSVTEWDRYPARFAALDSVKINARVTGHITKIHFQDGQMVRQGDPLFTIDQRPYRALVAVSEASVAEARAQVTLSEAKLDRTLKLERQGHVSKAQSDLAKAEMASAVAALSAATAQLEKTQLDLEYSIIRSPISGRADAANFDVGALITGQDTEEEVLTTIVALDPIHLVFDVDQIALLKYMDLAKKGLRDSSRTTANPVRITLPNNVKLPNTGQMDFVANSIDVGTGTIRARAIIDNPDFLLTPGMFASAELLSRRDAPTVLVPDRAIATEQTLKTVFVVSETGTVASRIVTTGPLHEGLRVIRSGLEEGEKVIVDGRHKTSVGGTVTAVLEDRPTELAATRLSEN